MSPQAATTPVSTEAPADSKLVRSAARGDQAAFGSLVERYGGQLVFALQGRMTDRDLAADVAQEAWVRVASGLSGFHVGQRFRPWLFAIAFNALRDHHRKVGNRAEFGADDLNLDDMVGRRAGVTQGDVDEQEAIALALAEVEEPYQSALRLVDVLGFDYAEAARSLDCAEGTVKSRLSRGRRAFRESYERLVGTLENQETRGAEETPPVRL